MDAERTTPVKHILFPIAKNHHVPHQLRLNCYSTRVSLNCPKVRQGNFGILAILEPRLDASWMNESKPVCLRNIVLLSLRTLSAVPASSCPNESLGQVVFRLDRNDAPIL